MGFALNYTVLRFARTDFNNEFEYTKVHHCDVKIKWNCDTLLQSELWKETSHRGIFAPRPRGYLGRNHHTETPCFVQAPMFNGFARITFRLIRCSWRKTFSVVRLHDWACRNYRLSRFSFRLQQNTLLHAIFSVINEKGINHWNTAVTIGTTYSPPFPPKKTWHFFFFCQHGVISLGESCITVNG